MSNSSDFVPDDIASDGSIEPTDALGSPVQMERLGTASERMSTGLVQLEDRIRECVANVETKILESFEGKLKFDDFKEQQIARLHEELQEYKRGFADTLLKPFVIQLVRFLDQMPRHVESLKTKPAEEVTRERLFNELENVTEDLQMILENVGVEVFRSTETRFDPRLQQARLTVEVYEPEKHQIVAESLLSGYKLDGKLIEKERVKVFLYREGQAIPSMLDAATQSSEKVETNACDTTKEIQ